MFSTGLLLAPGLHGGFLFDDYGSLPVLGDTGPIHSWATFWRYITSGYADPTGRPLALLSFLLDARDWPAIPFPFKRTNLLLHLLNGGLLALLLRQLGRHIQNRFAQHDSSPIDKAALLGASIWLLHPLFVSTTLYIVQREAMLPATFTLIGLLLWLHGRRAIQQGRTTAGLMEIVAGLGGCTSLATLSKANGILLPALALVIEYILLRSYESAGHPATAPANVKAMRHGIRWDDNKTYRNTMLLFAWLPTSMVAAYLLQQGWSGLIHGISSARPWTLGQRLLTEPRVLMDYLTLLWMPRPFTPGLFNDQIQASTSLWSPITTLPALCSIVALIAGSWRLRQRWPSLATGILFYFVGQSLESSTVALELYFEHRNYLPAMLLFWPLALWLCDAYVVTVKITGRSHVSRATSRLAKPALSALILLGLGLMTHARATLWGDSRDQAMLWAALNPNSPRAQTYAADIEIANNQPQQAIARLQPLLTKYPDQVQLALPLISAECQTGQIDSATIRAARLSLSTARDTGALLANWFNQTINEIGTTPCPQLTYDTIDSLLDSSLTNPYLSAIQGREQDIYHLKGHLALSRGDAQTALNDFNHALDLQVRPAIALEQAAMLGSAGHPRLGLIHLDHYDAERNQEAQPDFGMPRLHDWVLRRQQYWPREIMHLRATLQSDTTRQTSRNP
ncbi:tetratricopeptide repeat protein [Dyella caseinilytica]|uniref:Tetratricopeptide repeat protein n=1 Tax=Dyella caseinilytica TaxID=1849581 RepID=A0ABX7GX16_9GAMM|nr:tetratricopeptide repeat protein [Dyella caseinilytica]QRN54399.1 tetratricopeptide repeat protein [Dyella caseinilytica]